MQRETTSQEMAAQVFAPGRELGQSLLLFGSLLTAIAATLGVATLVARVLAG